MSTTDATLRMVLLGEDRSASKALGNVGDHAQKTSGHLHSLGKVAAGVFAGGALFEGAAKGVEFLKGAAEAAAQDQANNAVLERQLHNTTGATKEQVKATEEWLTKTAEASGTAKTDLTPTLTRLATVTGSVGKAQRLTTLAMNVAAGTHQNLTSITGAFIRAQNGSVAGLSRLGIATKNADGTTKTFTQVQKELAKQFKGDTAAAADTAAGRMKRLGVTWEEMKVQIGSHLLPVLTTFAGFMLDKVLPAIGQVIGIIETKAIPFIENLADSFDKNTGSMSTTAKQDLGSIEDTFKSVVSIVRSLWQRFGGFLTTYLINTLKNIVQALSGVFQIIQGIFKVFSSLLKGDWKGVWVGIKQILAGALQVIMAVLKQALNLVKLMWKVGWSILKGILSQVWDGIKALIRLEIQSVIGLIKGLPGAISRVGPLMLSAGRFLIQQLFKGIVSAAKAGVGFASDLISAVKNAINSALHLPLQVNFDKGPIHIHATVIPALAKGGIVTRPTMALIGEAGPEAVVPLSGANRGGLGGGDVVVNVYTKGSLSDSQSIMRDVRTGLLRLKREGLGNQALGLG